MVDQRCIKADGTLPSGCYRAKYRTADAQKIGSIAADRDNSALYPFRETIVKFKEFLYKDKGPRRSRGIRRMDDMMAGFRAVGRRGGRIGSVDGGSVLKAGFVFANF